MLEVCDASAAKKASPEAVGGVLAGPLLLLLPLMLRAAAIPKGIDSQGITDTRKLSAERRIRADLRAVRHAEAVHQRLEDLQLRPQAAQVLGAQCRPVLRKTAPTSARCGRRPRARLRAASAYFHVGVFALMSI